MKLSRFTSLSAMLAFGASILCGQANSSANAAATVWSHGFEAAEGYRVGESAAGAHVSLTGGTASIMDTGAAEGEQFLRFIPKQADDALVIRLPAEFSKDVEGTIAFAVRLVSGAQTTRLVLSQRWTVALQPVAGGLVIETNENPPRRVNLPLEPDDWLPLGLRERSTSDTWDLLVSGQVVLAGLPRQRAVDALADLLIFADGSLDIDAISLTAQTDAAADNDPSGKGEGATAGTSASIRLTPKERSDWIALALDAARDSDYALAVVTAEKLARHNSEPMAQDMETAQVLAMIAYALRDGGLHEQAAALGRLALQPLSLARDKGAQKSTPDRVRAAFEFAAAQINEQLLGDATEAERYFKKTLEFFPEHEGARGGEQRLARQRELAAKERALTGFDAPTGADVGGGK